MEGGREEERERRERRRDGGRKEGRKGGREGGVGRERGVGLGDLDEWMWTDVGLWGCGRMWVVDGCGVMGLWTDVGLWGCGRMWGYEGGDGCGVMRVGTDVGLWVGTGDATLLLRPHKETGGY